MSTKPNWPLRAFPNVGDGPLYDGLSKRELFAALAMNGLLAANARGINDPDYTMNFDPERLSQWAVQHADALIAALDRTARNADEGQKP